MLGIFESGTDVLLYFQKLMRVVEIDCHFLPLTFVLEHLIIPSSRIHAFRNEGPVTVVLKSLWLTKTLFA